MDRVAYRFDLREMPSEVPAQVCISLDNTTLTVDGFLYLQITDAVKAAYGSSNPMNAAMQLAQTSMRSEIGKLHLDQALSSRQMLNAAVAAAVEEAAVNWGIKVLRYEIRDITPPQAILHAMELQITAEREKRAIIFKSEGERQQQINTSEGQRQREINLADGRRQAEILRAEGEAKAIELVPLHRGFDGLLVVSAQGRQSGGVDEHFDAAGDARLSSDEPGALEREDHLVDRRRADMESALQIGFGRGATEHLSIGVDKG